MGLPIDNSVKPNNMGPAGTFAIGAGAGVVNGILDLAFGKQKMKQQLKGQKQALAQSNEAQLDLWNKTNYGAQMEHLKAAGLNPGLLYGMGGAGGATTGSGGGMPSNQSNAGLDIMGAAQMQLIRAQAEKLEAETEEIRGDTYKPGEKSANLNADTENKILEKVIRDFTGKEMGEQWKIKQGWRSVESETYGSNLEAQQATAKTLYDNWVNGNLQKMTDEQVEQLIVGNAKSRAERKNLEAGYDLILENIKGKKIENLISDLERRLQEQTGIDKNSPYFIKILGRLIVQLMGGK